MLGQIDSDLGVLQCFQMYVEHVREIVTSPLAESEVGHVLTNLQKVFRYLDQHYTQTKPRPGASVTSEPTSKLCPGQSLKEVEGLISVDPSWSPNFYAATVPSPGIYRAESASAPQPLTRATSFKTLNNIGDLKAWMAETAQKWVEGESITPAEAAEGHALVYKICTESSQPKDAENQCYTLYLDYCRGICGQFSGKERRTSLRALQTVFKYLDQHFTNVKDRPGMVRGKQPTSKLCAGQDLKTAAAAIEADPLWIPDYQTPAPAPAPVPAPAPAPAAEASIIVISSSHVTLVLCTSRW